MGTAEKKKRVLFLCNHNAARSQIAEGLLKSLYGEYYDVESAGNDPSHLSMYATRVMADIGVDISHQRSKSMEEFEGVEFEYIVTLCGGSGEVCPVFLGGKNHIYKSFKDPKSLKGSEEDKLLVFREVRDELKVWIEETFQPKKNS